MMTFLYPISTAFLHAFDQQLQGVNLNRRKGISFIGISTILCEFYKYVAKIRNQLRITMIA
jgi:hypothetical protein